MVKLDTIRIDIPFDVIKDYDHSHKWRWEHEQKKVSHVFRQNPDEEEIVKDRFVKDKAILKDIDNGFNYLELDYVHEKATLDTSAKILKEQYRDGISRNTIERYAEEIKSKGIIDFELDDFLAKSKIRRVDATNTIEVQDLDKSVASVLSHGAIHTKFNIDRYKTGYVAQNKASSYNERQVGYEKLSEIITDKNFIKSTPKVLESFTKNSLRIESNYTKFADMRKAFHVTNNTLGAIINSSATPNLTLFKKIVDRGMQLSLFSDKYAGKKLSEIEKQIGMETIIKQLDTWESIEAFLRTFRTKKSNNFHTYKKRYLEKYEELNRKEFKVSHAHIEEILSKLKVA